MESWRALAALVCVVLVGAPVGAGGPALAQSVTGSPELPCPVVDVDPPPDTLPQPTPPSHGPGERELGGAALATAGLVVPPAAPPVPDVLSATYWLVADLDSGAVLGGCGPHEFAIPASTQKLLLAAAVLPQLDPTEVVEVIPEDLDIVPGSSAVGLLVGGEYTVELLWLGLLLNSGNEAANVLARLGGGEAGVVGGLAAMNKEAARLGAFQTHAATPSGLDGPGQFTSAYDLALIARSLYDRQDFQRYILTERADMPPQPPQDRRGFEFQNNNGLLPGNYPGALGGKTGFTSMARHSFVGAAQRDGRRLVVTLLGAEAQPMRSWQQGAALLDWGFSLPPDAEVGRLVEPAELAEVATSSTTQPAVAAAPVPTGGLVGSGEGMPVLAAGIGVVSVAVAGWLLGLAVRSARRRHGDR